MTKILLTIYLLSPCFFTWLNVTEYNNQINAPQTLKINAIPNQESGLFLFVESKPNCNFIELGTIKAGLTFSGQYNELKKEIIKRCLKNYPGANGLIFITEKDCSQAIAIKIDLQ